MIVVTGGAGFIGSRIVAGLNADGHHDVLVVDDLTDGHKFKNLVNLSITDYCDKIDFLEHLKKPSFAEKIAVIFHQGACSTTTEWNGKMMMQNNYEYSKTLLHFSIKQQIPFLYASSAAIYGGSDVFKEQPQYEKPLNVYGYSKLLFDQYVRKVAENATNPIIGFRYFNVYGPNEQHKGSMASVAYHLRGQLQQGDTVKLFQGSGGYGDGEQRRDFIYVDDVVSVNLWAWKKQLSGIYNLGTGRSQSFNDVANAVIRWHQRGQIEYIPFPEHLKSAYQSFTEADMSLLRAAGYHQAFQSVEQGVKAYLDVLAAQDTAQ